MTAFLAILSTIGANLGLFPAAFRLIVLTPIIVKLAWQMYTKNYGLPAIFDGLAFWFHLAQIIVLLLVVVRDGAVTYTTLATAAPATKS